MADNWKGIFTQSSESGLPSNSLPNRTTANDDIRDYVVPEGNTYDTVALEENTPCHAAFPHHTTAPINTLMLNGPSDTQSTLDFGWRPSKPTDSPRDLFIFYFSGFK
jgi:hypothetical protein